MLQLRGLQHLVTLARYLNFSRAAEELGITQPTLSRSIQAMERQLEMKLFERDTGGVSLTPQGREMVERAIMLLADADDLEQHLRLSAKGEGGQIRFGMTPMPAKALLTSLLARQIADVPAVSHEVFIRDTELLWGMLVGGHIEFFVSPDPPRHDLSRMRVESLGTFALSLIVRAGHPLLTGSQERFPLLRSSWTGIAIPDEIASRILGRPTIVEDFTTLSELATRTDAMWLSAPGAIADEIASGRLVEYMPLNRRVELTLYSTKRRSPSPLARKLAAMLRDSAQRLQ